MVKELKFLWTLLCTESEDYKKWRHKNGATYFFAGTASDFEDFLSHCGKDKPVPNIAPELSCIKMQEGKAYECAFGDDGVYWEMELHYNCAIGSGSSYALAAMDFGKSAGEAVEYAATKDCFTNSEVTVFNVE